MFFLFTCKLSKVLCNFTAWVCFETSTCIVKTLYRNDRLPFDVEPATSHLWLQYDFFCTKVPKEVVWRRLAHINRADQTEIAVILLSCCVGRVFSIHIFSWHDIDSRYTCRIWLVMLHPSSLCCFKLAIKLGTCSKSWCFLLSASILREYIFLRSTVYSYHKNIS